MSKETADLLHRIDLPKPHLIYRYNPLKSIFVKCIFLVLCAAVEFIVLSYAPIVTLVVSILSIILLFHLLKTCSIKVWLDWPNLIYVYRSCFRVIDEVIPSWEISGISPEITSMWRGTVTERLFLEVGARKFLLTPYYSERDPEIARLMMEIRNLPSSRKQAESEIELERKAVEGANTEKQDD